MMVEGRHQQSGSRLAQGAAFAPPSPRGFCSNAVWLLPRPNDALSTGCRRASDRAHNTATDFGPLKIMPQPDMSLPDRNGDGLIQEKRFSDLPVIAATDKVLTVSATSSKTSPALLSCKSRTLQPPPFLAH
jgi:hypothetical protein